MDELKLSNQTPTFSTLTEIMERFRAVPYEEFQQELQAWFERGLADQGMDQAALEQSLQGFSQLIDGIYHRAEVQQTLSDHHITRSGNDDN